MTTKSSKMTAALLPHLESPLGYDNPIHSPRRLLFKMPRVVPDQKARFEADDLFRRLARDSEVRYTGYRDKPVEERRQRFQAGIREGMAEIAFITNGTNINLAFSPSTNGYSQHNDVDFDKEPGKVHLKSPFILNGVCVRWRGWLDLERLDGMGCLEYDEENAMAENRTLQEEIEKYKQRLRDLEDRQKAFRLTPSTNHAHSSPHHYGPNHNHTTEQQNIQKHNWSSVETRYRPYMHRRNHL